jgi:RimJ/RimL family protein N-acetyltransferase|tara:strand:- start:49 stop:429 length:381 start_codon:yes stop_codon:yes gene_type:complete
MQVSVKRLKPNDAFHLRRILDKDTASKCHLTWPFTKEVAKTFISDYNTYGIWVNGGVLVGAIEVKKSLETAYFVSPTYRNKGIATRAVTECKGLFGKKQLWCVINPKNRASLKVAEKAKIRVNFVS